LALPIANKLRNHLLLTKNKVQHKSNHNIFAADLRLFVVSNPVTTPSPAFQVFSPNIPSSAAGSDEVILSDPMCPSIV